VILIAFVHAKFQINPLFRLPFDYNVRIELSVVQTITKEEV